MFSALWIKLALSAGVIALVAGGYWYVHSLQNQVEKLGEQNVLLQSSNEQLTQTIKDTQTQLENVDKVSKAGDTLRIEYRTVYEKQLQGVEQGIKDKKDRPVGPILKDFFNAE